MIERKKYGITPLCESGKGKFISGAAARHCHGFHTRPYIVKYPTFARSICPPCLFFTLDYHEISSARDNDRGNFLTEV